MSKMTKAEAIYRKAMDAAAKDYEDAIARSAGDRWKAACAAKETYDATVHLASQGYKKAMLSQVAPMAHGKVATKVTISAKEISPERVKEDRRAKEEKIKKTQRGVAAAVKAYDEAIAKPRSDYERAARAAARNREEAEKAVEAARGSYKRVMAKLDRVYGKALATAVRDRDQAMRAARNLPREEKEETKLNVVDWKKAVKKQLRLEGFRLKKDSRTYWSPSRPGIAVIITEGGVSVIDHGKTKPFPFKMFSNYGWTGPRFINALHGGNDPMLGPA